MLPRPLSLSALLCILILDGCETDSTLQGSSQKLSHDSRSAAVAEATTSTEGTRVKLLDGEVVTILSGNKPPLPTPDQIPSGLTALVASNQDGTIGMFRNIIPDLPTSTGPALPAPYSGIPQSSGAETIDAAKHRDAATGGNADHSDQGWAYGSANNPTHPYYGEGFTIFAVDVSAPTLYLNAPGETADSYVYFAPTVQGTDGEPLEMSYSTYYTSQGSSGTAEIKVYDFTAANGLPCNGPSQQTCKGFQSKVVPINSTFFSNYVRNIGESVAEFSVEEFKSNNTWYATIYNHNTSTYDVIGSEAHNEVVYDQRYKNGTLGTTGGHAYDEYYLPKNTTCASVDPSNPLSGEPLTSNAQQYSSTSGSWVRVSSDSNSYADSGGYLTCFSTPSPYQTFGYFGDGRSNWQAIPN